LDGIAIVIEIAEYKCSTEYKEKKVEREARGARRNVLS